MSYNHILVAVDFAKENLEVIDKAIKLAEPSNTKISLIHLNNQITDEDNFGGLIDTDLAEIEPAHTTNAELAKKLDDLAESVDYPIENKFLVKGNINHGLEAPVKKAEIDLIICGHHHDFWSRLKPTASGLINTSPVDLLIVPLDK